MWKVNFQFSGVSPAESLPSLLLITSILVGTQAARSADQPQWGQKFSRNMISDEKNLPDSFANSVKWKAALGDQSYGTAIVANGRVLISTNNERPRDPRHQGDRGVLMCFDEKDGHFCWQLVVPKMEDDPYLDWPKVGMASTPTVEGDRVYTLTNRGEVVCLDLVRMANGNDGPFKDEGRHMTPRGQPVMEPGPLDADIIWLCDLVKEAGVHIHDQVEGSILIDGDHLYVNSNNGVDNTHRRIRSPNAPSLVVLDKRTGKIVARDDEHIGPKIFHSTWSSPSLGVVNGRRMIFFGGCDGFCYAFDALDPTAKSNSSVILHNVWKFDCDPAGPKGDIHKYISNRKEGPAEILGMPVFVDNRIYVVATGDLWWGLRRSWLKCIDATKAGDVTRSAELWSRALPRECCSTPAVYRGLVFVADCGGNIHCIDAATGEPVWSHKADGGFWASPMIADGKLYIGTRAGEFDVLAASREKRLVSSSQIDDPISATVTPADGKLFVATMRNLYMLSK
jgi:outer membrane protein assembly factor BamB